MEYQVAIVEVDAQQIVSIRKRLSQREIPTFLAASFAELIGRLGLLGARPAGAPFVVYHEFGPREIDAEVCMPIDRPIDASGRVRSGTLPAMTVARTLHVGPYEKLGEAYRAITEWAERQGVEGQGPLRERYLVGIGDMVPPAEYRTEVEMPIVATTAAVPA